jgi:hypothetical protein
MRALTDMRSILDGAAGDRRGICVKLEYQFRSHGRLESCRLNRECYAASTALPRKPSPAKYCCSPGGSGDARPLAHGTGRRLHWVVLFLKMTPAEG